VSQASLRGKDADVDTLSKSCASEKERGREGEKEQRGRKRGERQRLSKSEK